MWQIRFRGSETYLPLFFHWISLLPGSPSVFSLSHSKCKPYCILKYEVQVLGKVEACFKYVSRMAYKLFLVRAVSSAACNMLFLFLSWIILKLPLKHTMIILAHLNKKGRWSFTRMREIIYQETIIRPKAFELNSLKKVLGFVVLWVFWLVFVGFF